MKKLMVGFLIASSVILAFGCTSKEEQAKIEAEEQAKVDAEIIQMFGKTPEEMEKDNESSLREANDKVIENNKKQAEERNGWEIMVDKLGGMEQEYAEISNSSYDENLYATVINNISKLGETVKMPVELNDVLGSGDVVILGTSIKNGEVLQVTKVHQDHNNTQEYIYEGVVYTKELVNE